MRAPFSIKRGMVTISAVILCFAAGCSREQLPQTYGIYVRDGHALTRLENGMPEEKRRNFSTNLTFVIFDRQLATLGIGATQGDAQILSRRFARFYVVLEHDVQNGPVVNAMLAPANVYKAFDAHVTCDVMPVKGQQEMIEFKPRSPLEKGLYYFVFAGETLPFGVGIGNDTEKTSPYSPVLDGFTDQPSTNAAFSWDNWTAHIGQNIGEDHNNYKDAKVLDAIIADYRKKFDASLGTNHFAECLRFVPALSAYYGTSRGFTNMVAEAMVKFADSKLADDPQVAVALANRTLMLCPANVDALRIARAGTNSLNERNEKQIAEVKRRMATQNERWQAMHATNTVIATIPVYPDDWPTQTRGRITITETALVLEWEDKYRGRHSGLVWFGDLERLGKFVKNQTTPSLMIIAKDNSYHAQFANEEDRDNAQNRIATALADFETKFRPSASENSDFGTVLRVVENDSVKYVIQLDELYWSQPVHIPENCRSWRWKFCGRNYGAPFDLKTEDGTITHSDSFHVDRNSTLTFRSHDKRTLLDSTAIELICNLD